MQIRHSFLRDARVVALGAIFLATSGALVLAVPSMAAPASSTRADVRAELLAFKVSGDKLVPAQNANSGDTIEYQAR